MPTVRLSALVEEAGVRCSMDGPDPVVTSLVADSRKVAPGSLFVCMPSPHRDTHEFLGAAADAGAVACVIRDPSALQVARARGLATVGLTEEGQSFNFALGRLCRAFHDDPTRDAQVVGITGTNGKTTTAWLVRNALERLGTRAAYLGTLGFQSGSSMRTLENTTPFPVELWDLLTEAATDGCEAVVMEASSHALYQRRLAGVSFDVGVFTNLSQDHLDFHGDMESYTEAKKLLFTEYAAASQKGFAACLNVEEPVAAGWLPDLAVPVFSYSARGQAEESGAMLVTSGADVRVDGLTLNVLNGPSRRLRLGGHYNVENATAALSALSALGFELDEALEAIADVPPVPGRFEPIENNLGIGVIVDYAHTPDALLSLLQSVRQLPHERVVTVFGCGGDRDRSKRPKMAAAVSYLSDLTIVTSDNPRTEDPEAIMDEIVPGVVPGAEHLRITDRRAAIRQAISLARPGDVVVIAGKGHEDYQIIGREKTHLSDQETAREALAELAGVSG